MRAAKLFLLAAVVAPLFAIYTYYRSDTFAIINPSFWTSNGVLTPNAPGLTSTDANGGSVISAEAAPGIANEYEVSMTLNLAASGGTYVSYLRASTNALSGPAAQGTYYAVELQDPVVSGGSCVATLAVYQKDATGVSLLASLPVVCHNGMVVRSIIVHGNNLCVYIDNAMYIYTTPTALSSGQPGVGVRGMAAGNSIARADLGAADTDAPSPVNSQSIGVSAFPNSVDVQWRPPDDKGTGIYDYSIFRDGAYVLSERSQQFTDAALSPGTTYTYTITAADFHVNYSSMTFTVTTPPADAIDPRRVGVRPLGVYWGGMGEQIDTRSGNLNYTLPLLKAQGRGGWGVTFALSYNSQLWRQDPAGTWKLGWDVGYGFGWRLMAGSLMPYWSDWLTMASYYTS